MGQDLSDRPASEFNNSIIIGSCFYQENKPDSHIFPEDMTGVVFQKCNLDNVFIPAGNTIKVSNTDKRIKAQNDKEDWIVDKDNKPIEPMNKEMFLELELSIKPEDIPNEKMDTPITFR